MRVICRMSFPGGVTRPFGGQMPRVFFPKPRVYFQVFRGVLGGKVEICGRDNLFLTLHLTLDEKVDICGRDDHFFALYLTLG